MRKLIFGNILHLILCIIAGIFGIGGLISCYLFSEMKKILLLGPLAFFTGHISITVALLFCVIFLILLVVYSKKLKKKWSKIIFICSTSLSALICFYMIFCLLIYTFQDKLISVNNMIFQPSQIMNEASALYVEDKVEEISVVSGDTKLNGWLVKNSPEKRAPLIIYFGGSGQEVSEMIQYVKQINGWSVALINYRGFGSSGGAPSQNAVFQDAEFIFDALSKREDIDNQRIVTMGWSLGTAVSVYLSDNRPIKGTILVSPFDNMYSRIQPSIPYIPLSIIMKQPFNSISRAPSIKTPLLCLIGDSDVNIPPKFSLRLVERWKGEHIVKTYKNADHFLLFDNNNSWKDINNFLKKLD